MENIRSLAKRSISTWNDFFGELQVLKVPTNEPVTQVNKSLDEINNSLVPRLGFIASLRPEEEENEVLIPPRLVPQLQSQLETISTNLEHLVRVINEAKANSGVLQFSALDGYIRSSNGVQTQVYPTIAQLVAGSEAAIEFAVAMYASIKVKGLADLSESINTYRGKINEIEVSVQAAKDAASKSQADANKARNITEKLEQQRKVSDEHSSQIAKFLEVVTNQASQATNNAQSIEQVLANARQLSQQVDDYKAQFDNFDKQMTQRREAIAAIERDLSQAQAENEKRELEIQRLMEASNQLIKGATVAGLASSFHETYVDYRKRADVAGIVVYLALGTLLISVGFLGLYVYPGDLGVLGFLQGQPVDLPGVIGRAILIVPALAFVSFAGRRYAALFAMQREYAHRVTLAKAIEGFRRLAPNYEQEITGAVFLALNQNPFQNNSKGEVGESRDTDNLLKSLVDSVPEILKRLGR